MSKWLWLERRMVKGKGGKLSVVGPFDEDKSTQCMMSFYVVRI